MLRALDVSVRAGRATLLRHAGIEIRPGELVALAGENGAGKSTLLRVLSGELKPASGTASLDGRPLYLWSLGEQAKRRAVLPQDGHVAFGFTALETALLGRYPHTGGYPGAADAAIAREALVQCDAAHLADRVVQTLSGGERARVMLARALAQIWESRPGAPRYLLLDEPVAALDLAHQHLALRVAQGFARGRGAGVLAVLHDLNLAARYADRVVVLKGGSVAAEGTPSAVLTEATIEACFATPAVVMRHPRHDCPLVVPTP